MAASAPEGSSASEVGVKRSADAPPAGESPAKAVKVEPAEKQEERKAEPVGEKKEEKKEDLKDEKKEEVKKEEAKVKKENGEKEKDKEKKEKKEKKDKSEKKEKKDKKEENGMKKAPSLVSQPSSQDLDHRKLFKEGQRFLTPPMADSTRAFYESLLQENPESKIAIKFCVEYGLCPLEEHKRLLKRYLVLKEKGVYDMRTQIKRALEKKEKKDKKDKADKKDKKEKDGEKKEKKEDKKEDKAAPAA